MSSFDLQLFTLHVASHLVGEETIRRALSSSSNDESSNSRHLFSWRSPPLAPGSGDYDCNGVGVDDENVHQSQEQKEKDEESRNASLVFLEVIFDWHPMDSGTPATLDSKSSTSTTNTQQQQPPTTRKIHMQVNALLRLSQDGTGLCVGVVPATAPQEVGEVRVTLQDLERHFEQISIDVTSTPEIVLATTFANALLAMHTHSNDGLPTPPPATTAENPSLDRSRTCVLKSMPESGDVQAHIPLWYQDLQDTATWTIRQPATSTTTSLDHLSTIPSAAMSMWMRSLTPPITTPTHMLTSASTFTTGDPLLLSAEKSVSTPQKVKPPAAAAAPPAAMDLVTLFQEWRRTPVVKSVALPVADPLHSHAAPEKEHGGPVGFLDRESPGGATTLDSVPAGGSPAEQKKVVQIKRKHGFTRIPSKKKKTGKLKFAGAD
jgi:hypothetical protein